MIKKKHIKKVLLLMMLLSVVESICIAQSDTIKPTDLSEIAFADLLKIKIATNKEQTLEEAPSIVSVITKKV